MPKHLQHDVQHELERAHTHAPTRGLTRIGPTRRSVLVGASAAMGLFGVGALTSCGNDQPAPEAIDVQPTPAPEPDPNLIDELNLIGAYLGAIEAFPELRGSLSAIADQHRAHAAELGVTDEQLTQVTAILPAAVAPKSAIGELIARERAAAELRAETALVSTESTAVRALTFIAASESSHIPELRDLRSGQ